MRAAPRTFHSVSTNPSWVRRRLVAVARVSPLYSSRFFSSSAVNLYFWAADSRSTSRRVVTPCRLFSPFAMVESPEVMRPHRHKADVLRQKPPQFADFGFRCGGGVLGGQAGDEGFPRKRRKGVRQFACPDLGRRPLIEANHPQRVSG